MCGRYVSRTEKQRIAETFHAHIVPEDYDPDFVPDYNVAPQTMQPVVRRSRDTGERELARLRWGLVPFWAKDTKIAYSTINARAESLATSSTYREALKHRRCLIPADAFYEWRQIDKKTKQPYAIALADDQLMAFAGLWERWKDQKTGQSRETYTIITTDPNDLMEPFHDRMPAILSPKDFARWLGETEAQPMLPLDLLRPYPAEKMKAWKVGNKVGNTRNNFPELLEPIETDKPEYLSLFGEPEEA
jgi:putative SOS response-associated peptidase YedK